MKQSTRLLLLLSLLVCPAIAHAAGTGNAIVDYLNGGQDAINLFVIPAEDQSRLYLGQIFGSVGSALHGSGSQLMGEMFVIFNLALLALSGFFAGMMGIKFIVNASQDGSPMQKMSSVVPVRMVFGIGALVPSFNGYSSIQIIVMWIVMQGVGMANAVWDSALNYLNANHGFFYMPSAGNSAVDAGAGSAPQGHQLQDLETILNPQASSTGSSSTAGIPQLYQSAACMYANKKMNDIATAGVDQLSIFDHISTAYIAQPLWGDQACGTTGNGGGVVCFPSSMLNHSGCGAYKVQSGGASTAADKQSAMTYGIAAARQAINDLLPSAEGAVNSVAKFSGDSTQGWSGVCSPDNPTSCPPAQAFMTASDDYYTIIKSYMTSKLTSDCASLQDWFAGAENEGWLMAGMFYHSLITAQSQFGVNKSCSINALDSTNLLTTLNSPLKPTTGTGVYDQAYQTIFTQSSSSADNAPTAYAAIAKQILDSVNSANNDVGGQATQLDLVSASVYSAIAQHQTLSSGFFNETSDDHGIGNVHVKLNVASVNLVTALTDITAGLTGLYATESAGTGGALSVTASNFKTSGGPTGCILSSSNPSGKGCWLSLVSANALSPGVGLFGELYASQLGQAPDPVSSMRAIGLTMMNASMTYWTNTIEDVYLAMKHLADGYTRTMMGYGIGFGVAGIIPGLGNAAGIVSSALNGVLQLYYQLDVAGLTLYLPLGAAITAPMFILGVSLGLYVPFIPFLLFTFGVIGWFMAVIEAMVAAPLVALGVTHPEGHDLLGQSQQAVMLLVSIFVRPAIIVIGFFGGIILTYISMRIFNQGFLYILANYLQGFGVNIGSTDISSTLSMYVGVLGMLIVYTYAAMSVVDQCFSLIYQLPDKIMRWIGGPPEQSQAAQRLGEVKGGVVQQTAAPMAQGVAQQSASAPQVSPQGASGKLESGESDPDSSSGGGGDASKAETMAAEA